uniref:Kelch-like protein 13 n=1 Tax=Magallana gigas TaxID=29159 RepID=K1QJP9_MAGGI
MKDTMVVTTEVLPKREPIVVNRDVWYSYMSKEDADPQACWLERKRQERIKAEKAAMGASTSRVSTSTTSSSGSVILDSLKLRYIQQKVDRNQNQTPSPPSSVSSTASDYEVPRNPKKVQTSIRLNQQDPLNLEIQEPRSLANSGGSVEQYLKTHCSSEFKERDVTYDIILMTEDAVEDFNRHACSRRSMMNDNEKVLAWLRDHNRPKLDEYTGLQSMDCMIGRKPKQKHAPKMEGKSKDKHVKKKRSERDQKQDIADDCRKAMDISDDYRKAMVWGGDQWYMVGGARYKDSECPSPTNKVLVYSYETKEWRPVAPLNVARMEHSLCEVDGYIFAIGGIGEGNRLLSSVECYNPRTNCWFFVKALPEPRAAASTSAEGGNVCLKGGYSAIKNGQPSSSYYENEVELFYNMESNK